MLILGDVLFGTQVGTERRMPFLPPSFEQVAFSEAVIDSRLATPGCLFVALRGERVDGHDFLADAMAHGARGALVQREQIERLRLADPVTVLDTSNDAGWGSNHEAFLLIAVDEPLAAVQRLASFHRSRLTTTVIGVTGSVGKTSTKEATAAVLQQAFRTLKTPRSYNSEATLPIVLLQIADHHDVAVLEMGMYQPGDIALLADIARPQIGIVTNVGPSHLERVGSLDGIQQAKSELPRALPADGVAILNYDDRRVRAMAELTAARPFFYGCDASADLWGELIENRGFGGISIRAHYQGAAVELELPLIGVHSLYTALAGAAAGLVMGMEWDAIRAGLQHAGTAARLRTLSGPHGTTLIDDTYNAAPASMQAALQILAATPGRRIAVLGDMRELGTIEEAAHRQVGEWAAGIADILVTLGRCGRWIAIGAREAGMPAEQIIAVDERAEVVALLEELIVPGDTILLKGSRAMEMEQIVAALAAPVQQIS
ncbi:MAG TPA: UDP-N-acetylmuramoyl-tripeptide--D-alanyl-D-alanine ligase [Roseiflexaceae bacterium]|nr:UDP-N-acetylmuramoyl-tripeptide--D-alanyl-D-alanine ligase [Roseiflexaceae bacterium]HMP40425.1 UDP-N-acetylmuramoyl-tripeptide--D-alanyl-D-alanine ligase [Roseiflexaceae bacterium]